MYPSIRYTVGHEEASRRAASIVAESLSFRRNRLRYGFCCVFLLFVLFVGMPVSSGTASLVAFSLAVGIGLVVRRETRGFFEHVVTDGEVFLECRPEHLVIETAAARATVPWTAVDVLSIGIDYLVLNVSEPALVVYVPADRLELVFAEAIFDAADPLTPFEPERKSPRMRKAYIILLLMWLGISLVDRSARSCSPELPDPPPGGMWLFDGQNDDAWALRDTATGERVVILARC